MVTIVAIDHELICDVWLDCSSTESREHAAARGRWSKNRRTRSGMHAPKLEVPYHQGKTTAFLVMCSHLNELNHSKFIFPFMGFDSFDSTRLSWCGRVKL